MNTSVLIRVLSLLCKHSIHGALCKHTNTDMSECLQYGCLSLVDPMGHSVGAEIAKLIDRVTTDGFCSIFLKLWEKPEHCG